MKKIGIVTIYDNNNFGNRLQNYAVQESIKKLDVETFSIKYERNYETKFLYKLKRRVRYIKWFLLRHNKYSKLSLFKKFNKNIEISKCLYNCKNINKIDNIDCFVVGSDQVWNPNFGRLTDIELLNFTEKSKVAFSASFGISELPEEYKEKTEMALNKFKAISVREDAGKKIVEDLTGRTDVEVLVDPTMLLSAEEWDNVSKKPRKLKDDKYILNYFLGELPENWKIEIDRIAKENNCEVINILSQNDPFYQTGPSEFLYLEKNAFLVCTDSFHSSVFSIIYDTPFVVFERQDKLTSMNSRIDTLLSKFNLQNRRFNGEIREELLKSDYKEAKNILEKEKQKSFNFLKKALDIE